MKKLIAIALTVVALVASLPAVAKDKEEEKYSEYALGQIPPDISTVESIFINQCDEKATIFIFVNASPIIHGYNFDSEQLTFRYQEDIVVPTMHLKFRVTLVDANMRIKWGVMDPVIYLNKGHFEKIVKVGCIKSS